MSKSSSFLAFLLIAAIFGLFDMATAIQFSDFTDTGAGYCLDSANKEFTVASSPDIVYTDDVSMKNYCVSYCGQNLPTTFRGFETYHNTTTSIFYCNCVFDLPTFDEDSDLFPYQYTPKLDEDSTSGNDGTGPITGTKSSSPFYHCYKFKGTATGTASPTGFYTPAPTIPLSEFTKFAGACVDSSGNYFTIIDSKTRNYTDDAAAESYCRTWCGQNLVSTFRGFETFIPRNKTPPQFGCDCVFDMPAFDENTDTFPYDYSPDWENAYGDSGTGEIAGGDGKAWLTCYKYTGTSRPTGAPTTKPAPTTGAPTTKPTGAPTTKPTGAPTTKPAPDTKSPTKKPVGSCPVGVPPCSGAADCSGTVFSHCVDACCANIGSKSAKGTKSSKKV